MTTTESDRVQSGVRAAVHYDDAVFDLPVEIAEDVQDAMEGIDLLGGGHWFALIGSTTTTNIWLSSATPLRIEFPADYESPEDREDYVTRVLKMRARVELGLEPPRV